MKSNYKATVDREHLMDLLATRILQARAQIDGVYSVTLDRRAFFDQFSKAETFDVDVHKNIVYIDKINIPSQVAER